MKNSSTGAGERSSPSPNQTPNTPQRPDHGSPGHVGGGNTSSPNAERNSPQGRGMSVSAPSPLQRSPVAPPPSPPQLPVMGRPGQSAFSQYRPHRQLQFPSGSAGGAGGGLGFNQGRGLFGAQAIPVGGGAGGNATGGVGGVGPGSPGIRKRVRDGAPGAGNEGGAGQPQGGVPIQCSVCAKTFLTSKALFGHMRSHPGRGWKGAFPPPSFKAEEEFADLPHFNRGPPPPADVAHEDVPEVVDPLVPEEGVAPAGEAMEEHRDAPAEGGDDASGVPYFRVPDLNSSPPPESNSE